MLKDVPALMLKDVPAFSTPPVVATLLGTNSKKILHFIRTGELKASDLSMHRGSPRYKIAKSDLQAFLDSRASSPPAQPQPKRPKSDATQFYPE